MNLENLPYRKNVAVILFKEGKFLLVNKNEWPEDWWKFVQGGLDEGEGIEEGAIRELKEEVGTDKVEIVGISKHNNNYKWDNMEHRIKKKAIGQEQKFVIAKFIGDDSDIKVDDEEIRVAKWFSLQEVLDFCANNHNLFGMYNGFIPNILEEFKLR